MSWQDRVGAVEAGKYADLIAVEGDPLTDIAALQQVKFVMKGGTVVKDTLTHGDRSRCSGVLRNCRRSAGQPKP